MMPVRHRISYILRELEVEDQHRFGINDLAVSQDGSKLFSAGRDGIARQWNVSNRSNVQYHSQYNNHVDWINAVALCEDIGFLVTASSDSTLKVWTLNKGLLAATLNKHEDYVKAVRYSPVTKRFVSGGLDGKVVIWDISSMTEVTNTAIDTKVPSIYSIDINQEGTLIASGSSDKIVRLWDPRSRTKAGTMKGHSDVVKCMQMSQDGTRVLTGSADCNLKLWDLRQQRAVHTYGVHDSSVWTLEADADLKNVYSGDRDGTVIVTQTDDFTNDNSSQLLLTTDASICAMALSTATQTLWLGTVKSSFQAWDLSAYDSSAMDQKEDKIDKDDEEEAPPLLTEPSVVVQGRPAIVEHSILPDRRQVLTKNSEGVVQLWNILRGEVVDTYPDESIDDVRKSFATTAAYPSWFSVDHKLGCLTIHLEQSSCFKAWDLEDPSIIADTRYNLGATLLQALFRYYREGRDLDNMIATPTGAADIASARDRLHDKAVENRLAHNKFSLPANIMVALFKGHEVIAANMTGKLNRTTLPPDIVPDWLNTVLLYPDHESALDANKIQFHLLPDEQAEPKLPALKSSFLTSLSCFPVWRLARHVHNHNPEVQQRLAELEGEPHRWDSLPADQRIDIGASVYDVLEIVCEEQVLPPLMNLLHVRNNIWKQGGDMHLLFRWKADMAPTGE
eukprot:TRINITY_DN8907_c0_g1_i2.p1 TRINITY_DN8907_c0_g1~~TRINITY_DN8907_c0_g1_i2.p1  ORF type:complete len:676 (+),score=143.77 TRINITY_DN8907_c0_g1_i2:223-2250(+)